MLNLGLKDQYKEGVQELGFSIEDILEQERDAALGNGGLGRLAACYLDSSASQVCSTSRSPFILHIFTITRNFLSGVTV